MWLLRREGKREDVVPDLNHKRKIFCFCESGDFFVENDWEKCRRWIIDGKRNQNNDPWICEYNVKSSEDMTC